MVIKALIAVRSGSLRVQNKNLRPFAGSTLLDLKIKQLLSVKGLDGIVVNSNDESMLEAASKYKVELVKRDQQYATNEVRMSDVYENMADNFSGDVVMYANATSPLIETASVEKMIQLYREGGKFDSINSVNAVKKFMFLDGKPINYDPQRQPRSQDLPNIVSINFAISLIGRDTMIKRKNVVGSNPFLYEIPELEAVDIDTQFDFEIAEFLYQKRNGKG